MAKKKSATSVASPRTKPASPAQLQRELDRLDRETVKRLNERAKLTKKLAALRSAADAPVRDTIDDDTLQHAVDASKGPLSDDSIRAVFREVISGGRSLIRPVRVAYLGPMYSYSHLATTSRFGSSADLAAVATISAVFEELNRGHADYGVVPLENSTDGRVADTLGMFARHPLRICGEVQLRIHHNLLARTMREEIREVYSKPQALSQCRDWLAKHLPWARTVEMASTAAAAQLAAGKTGAAAVASRLAAVNYGLDIVCENIEDNTNNVTRFAVIGGQVAPRTGHDKTAIMFEISHSAGSLADVMGIFKRARLNLTWIESFPMPGSTNEYLFFVESQGHENDAKVKKALAALERRTVRLNVLGSYATSEPIE
jgi:chorismate mutase/prephenate dehydratase